MLQCRGYGRALVRPERNGCWKRDTMGSFYSFSLHRCYGQNGMRMDGVYSWPCTFRKPFLIPSRLIIERKRAYAVSGLGPVEFQFAKVENSWIRATVTLLFCKSSSMACIHCLNSLHHIVPAVFMFGRFQCESTTRSHCIGPFLTSTQQ